MSNAARLELISAKEVVVTCQTRHVPKVLVGFTTTAILYKRRFLHNIYVHVLQVASC